MSSTPADAIETKSVLVHLNNAAISFANPRSVLTGVNETLLAAPAEPGRAGGAADPLWKWVRA